MLQGTNTHAETPKQQEKSVKPLHCRPENIIWPGGSCPDCGLQGGGSSPPVPSPPVTSVWVCLQAGGTRKTWTTRWCTSCWRRAAAPGTTTSSACTRAAVPSTAPSCPRASRRAASSCPCQSSSRTSWVPPWWPLTGKAGGRLPWGCAPCQGPAEAPESQHHALTTGSLS